MQARVEAERGRRLDRAFDSASRTLDPRERAFAHELAYGATRLRGRLDHLISRHVHRGLESLHPGVLEVLRLGSYQLLYMASVPAYAAVSESVDQARVEAGAGAAGLVNAVLRKVASDGDALALFPSFQDDPEAFLSTWGSHPRWLVARWVRARGVEGARALVEANNLRPSVCLVPLDVEPEEACSRLAAAGLVAQPVGMGTRCVRLGEGVSPVAALQALPHSIAQDPAANLVTVYADVPIGTKVADLCAAPGGKALAVSGRAPGILAIDRSESRLHMVRANAARTGRALALVVADARRPPIREVDVVLLDAPCSGTGTLSRRPDARWRLRPETIADLANVQRELLIPAADTVRRGGLLVYSTCTLEPEENGAQVDAFLTARPDFRIESTGSVPGRWLDGFGRLTVTPTDGSFDGAFAARLRRAS